MLGEAYLPAAGGVPASSLFWREIYDLAPWASSKVMHLGADSDPDLQYPTEELYLSQAKK